MNSLCPCGSELEYSNCCEPYLKNKKLTNSAEATMRARYSAYVMAEEPFLHESLAPESRHDYNSKEVLEWAKSSQWLGLEILKSEPNQVEFIAKYKTQGKVLEHHETAKFRQEGNRWYFVEGDSHVHEEGKGHVDHPQKPETFKREGEKVGRNDPCSCGSGKKFKKCCGS